MAKQDLSILICSCDEYDDVWPPFFFFFNRHWPDCPWPLYLMTNNKDYNYPGLEIIKVGQGAWGTRFLRAVSRVKTKYILILMEDYFLLEKPDENFINQAIDFASENNASYLRLYPCPGPDRITAALEDIDIGEINKHSDYRVSLQAAIWDVDYINRLARKDDSPWDFEISGSERTNQMDDRLYSVSTETRYPISYYCTAVVKGCWKKEAVKMCRNNRLRLDLKKRKIEPFYLRRNIRPIIELLELKNNLKKRIPHQLRFNSTR